MKEKGFGMMSSFMRSALLVLGLLTVDASWAEDIDLFASGFSSSEATSAAPNILFVLDNNSNWATNSQGFSFVYDGTTYTTTGEAEVLAILESVDNARQQKTINVGVMTFVTSGSGANDVGSEVIFDMAPIGSEASDANYAKLETVLYSRLNKISSYTSGSNMPYGHLMADVYNYLAGLDQVQAGSGTNTSAYDSTAYVGGGTQTFISPLSEEALCSETYVIFVSNPQTSPSPDVLDGDKSGVSDNTELLTSLYSALAKTPAGLSDMDSAGTSPLPIRLFEGSASESNDLGSTKQCYNNETACDAGIIANKFESNAIKNACLSADDCSCVVGSGVSCKKNGSTFSVINNNVAPDGDLAVPSGGSWDSIGTPAGSWYAEGDKVNGKSVRFGLNMDDWAKFLYEEGVPVSLDSGDTFRMKIRTYTVDVFKNSPDYDNSALLDAAAYQGDAERFEASSYDKLINAFDSILDDIIDVNTAFAAVTLPLSATNRTNAQNRVFVGTFRPAQNREPRWMGNLKEYRLASFNESIELADSNYQQAINSLTGFARSCAKSYLTYDTSSETIFDIGADDPKVTMDNYTGAATTTGPYFTNFDFDFTSGGYCDETGANEVFSDSPDGPYVEKGGISQRIRYQTTRNIYVDNGLNSTAGTKLTSGLGTPVGSDLSSSDLLDYLLGVDPGYEGGDCDTKVNGYCQQGSDAAAVSYLAPKPAEGRAPTIHGDVIHSRPLTVSYGVGSSGNDLGFRIFYGANDGLFRAVDPGTGGENPATDGGEEVWALISSDHTDGIERLYRNSPTISYRGLPGSLLDEISADAKPYFFDGSTAAFTEYTNGKLSRGWIFPTMRRGGRLVYGIDVSLDGSGNIPEQPIIKWVKGCTSGSSSTCSAGWGEIGQTWSTPITGFVHGYESGDSYSPVLIMGGGWDDCLDPDLSGLDQTSSTYQDDVRAKLDDVPSRPSGCTTGNYIYVIDADDGSVIQKFETEYPVVAEVTGVDFDYDFSGVPLYDVVYALDSGGNLYRLNFAKLNEVGEPDTDAYTWNLETIAHTGNANLRLMNKPVVAYGFGKNVAIVTFGSGDRERPLEVDYPFQGPVTNKFYGFIDRPYTTATDLDLDASGSGGLIEVTSSGTQNYEFDIDSAVGFYVEMKGQGEQIVNPSAIAGDSVFFNSFQPLGGPQSICSNLGQAKGYRVNMFSPEPLEESEIDGGGIPIPPIIATVEDIPVVECTGESCTPVPEKTVDKTVCIGCDGFDPIDVTPTASGEQFEGYKVENIDKLDELTPGGS